LGIVAFLVGRFSNKWLRRTALIVLLLSPIALIALDMASSENPNGFPLWSSVITALIYGGWALFLIVGAVVAGGYAFGRKQGSARSR
jgi:hypothetical protein